jgi:peptidoglycan/LPS O-acetylase OafA/YrhL
MKQNLTTLQAGRGIAATAVLLHHVHSIADEHLGARFQTDFLDPGDRGVDFFFVLSGFIIFFANHKSLGVAEDAPRYLYRRIARVYPLVILLTLLKVGYVLMGGLRDRADQIDLTNILCSLGLVPQTMRAIIGPAWTLCFEMFFYLIFLVFILYGAKFRFVLVAHAAACLILNLPGTPHLRYPLDFIFNPYILEFYLGCLAGYLCLNYTIPSAAARAACFVGLAAMVVGYFVHDGLNNRLGVLAPLYWGPGFFLLVVGLAVLERAGLWQAPRWIAFSGDASYSIYLVHTSILEVAFRVITRHPGILNHFAPLTFAAITLLTFAGGVVCYLLIERPIMKWLYAHSPRKPVAPPPGAI